MFEKLQTGEKIHLLKAVPLCFPWQVMQMKCKIVPLPLHSKIKCGISILKNSNFLLRFQVKTR